MAEPRLQPHDEVTPVEMFAGVVRRTLNHGDATSLHEVSLAPGSVVPEHTHPHEQTGYVVAGRVRFVMPGLDRVLQRGDSYLVPGGIPHEVTAIEEAVVIDLFSPPREEFIP